MIELKDLFCMEWEFNREINLDATTAHSVIAFFGPIDSDKSNAFDITICNLDYVKKKEKDEGYFNGLWHLIIENPNKEKLKEYFQNQIKNLAGETWDDYYQQLRLIGRSEFENYIS